MESKGPESPLIKACGIRMAFGGVEVVKGVDLDLVPGQVHAVLGENGAGKSTMAKIMAGVYRPTAGHIELSGQEIRLENPRHALSLGIALIHQEPLTFPDLDVAENIFVGHQPVSGKLRTVDWKLMRERAQAILNELGVALSPTSQVQNLSVADRQMVELAAALSHDAKVLIMDETTASLTPKEVSELFVIARRLRDRGCAIAFVSHRLDEIFEISDRITVMRDGEKVGERLPKDTNVEEIVRLMVGRDLPTTSANFPQSSNPAIQQSSNPAIRLRVSNLSNPPYFEDISFELRAGEILGLGGLVGAGRTDVCRCVFGLTKPTRGSIEIDGKSVTMRSPREAMRHGLAMAPEDRQHEGLVMGMSLSENASMAALRNLSRAGWLRPMVERSVTMDFLSRLHAAYKSTDQPVRELSGGNQQKVVLAKWLATQPSILILDEPTRGVDVGAKAEVHALIRELVSKDLAILLVSSDLPELLDLSDRVIVMKAGRKVAEYDRTEANPESVMLAAVGQEVPV